MPTLVPESPPPAIQANQHVYDDYFRPDFTTTLDNNLLQLIDRVWFRSRLVGFENFPARNHSARPLIFASNHSGMAFPWDAIVALAHLWRVLPRRDMPRPLSAPLLSKTTLMNPYLIPDFWLRVGSVQATTLNFETMMYQQDYNLMVYPEGVPGIGKGFNHKYELQRLATSMVRMSVEHDTDIVPFYTVNAEYFNPFAYSFGWVNRLFRKIGIPFLPLTPLLLLVLLQPWAFYLALPAQPTFVMGTRIRVRDLLPPRAPAALTRADYQALSEQVRQRMQQELSAAVAAHGRRPYRWRELWQRMQENRRFFPFFLPFAWPVAFAEFERRYFKLGERGFHLPLDQPGSFWRYLWRNPLALAYFVPLLGWIPLAIKGYRNHKLGRRGKP